MMREKRMEFGVKEAIISQHSRKATFLSLMVESCLSTYLFFLMLPAYYIHEISRDFIFCYYY